MQIQIVAEKLAALDITMHCQNVFVFIALNILRVEECFKQNL